MRILHVLNHSLPYVDGYSLRSHSILYHQQKHGLEVVAVTSPKHGKFDAEMETIEGIIYYRTKQGEVRQNLSALPFIGEWLLMQRLRERILQVANQEKVDVIHSHSPSLNG